MKKAKSGNEGVLAGLFSAALGALAAARKAMPAADEPGDEHIADIAKNYLDGQKKKAKFVPVNAELDKQFKAVIASITALTKSLGLDGVKPLEVELNPDKVWEMGGKLNMLSDDVETWFYIYTLGYYPMANDGKCVPWRESLREYDRVLKRQKVECG